MERLHHGELFGTREVRRETDGFALAILLAIACAQ